MSENAQAVAEHGHMSTGEQQQTYHHFLQFALWGTLHIAMAVALLTVALAMGAGWFAGLAAFFVIGAGAGIGIRMGGAWWAALLIETVLLGIGGLIVSLVM